MNAAERDRILHEWNDTRAPFPDVCAHELFERQAARTPGSTAVAFLDRHMTYGELNARANQLAHHLRRRGVGRETLVGVCLERSPELVIALLAVWKAGGAWVPLDPSYPAERLSFMADDSDLQLLITDESLRRLFSSAPGRLLCVDTEGSLVDREIASDPPSISTPANLAYVMYTSGSTGKPKGAMILHRGLVNYLWWAIEAYGAGAGGSVPVHTSVSFDLTVTSLYPALLAGGQVELLPEDAGAQNLLEALRRGRDRRLVKITPAHLELLSRQLGADVAGMTRAFVIGGENLTAESLRVWREHAPATRLINEYGPTETVVGCCIYEVRPEDPQHGSVPIGRPIANTQLYVLDPELQPVPIGVTGELHIGGVGVARGYLNRPELTEQRFLPDPFSSEPAARLYKTGDLARYRKDGILEYLGRIDDQVKLRGYRIELGEIEQTLAAHPDVQSCAVLAREDSPGNRQLVGYVVCRHGASATAEALQDFLGTSLPEYMVPAKFVFLDSLPLTQNGKVDRKALPAPAVRQAVDEDRETAAPRSETEKKLAQMWSTLLEVERIDVDDDVFDLGAHSLMVVRAVTRMREVFQVDVQLRNLYEWPSIAGQAEVIDRLTWAARADAPVDAGGEREEIEL